MFSKNSNKSLLEKSDQYQNVEPWLWFFLACLWDFSIEIWLNRKNKILSMHLQDKSRWQLWHQPIHPYKIYGYPRTLQKYWSISADVQSDPTNCTCNFVGMILYVLAVFTFYNGLNGDKIDR